MDQNVLHALFSLLSFTFTSTLSIILMMLGMGACGGMYTANTMATAIEALGKI